MRFFPFIAALSLVAVPLQSQVETAPPSTGMSADEAVATAVERSLELRAAEHAIEAARARHRQAGRLPNPELEFDHMNDAAFNDEGERSIGLAVAQRLPLANRLRLARQVAEVDIALAEAELLEEKRQIAHAVRLKYLEVQAVEAQLDLRQRLADLNRELTEFIRSRVRTGEVSSLEANQALLEQRELTQEIKRLRVSRQRLLGEFRALLKLPPEAPVELISSMDAVFADAEGEADLPEYIVSRPDLLLADLSVDSAAARTALTEASKWEDLTVAVMFEEERSADAPNPIEKERFFGVGVSVALPLLDKKTDAIQERLALRRRAQALRSALALRIANEIATARTQLDELRGLARQFPAEVIQLAESNLEETRDAYAQGQIGLIEVLRAQEQRLALESQYLDILEDFLKARLTLRHAVGEEPFLRTDFSTNSATTTE